MIFADPIVNEMREAGKKLQKKCRNDLRLFSKMISAGTAKRKKEGWKVISKKDIATKDLIASKK
jgi:hypothetical protein